MVTCVLDGGGVVDKYIGDAIMALFGVPVSLGSPALDAQAAVRCAVQMSAALDRLNARRVAAGGLPVELGIGVHTGEVVAGNIGIPERMEYTVIGDTVNLCSRIEGLTRRPRRAGAAQQELRGAPRPTAKSRASRRDGER
jgi:adenylate cyclase